LVLRGGGFWILTKSTTEPKSRTQRSWKGIWLWISMAKGQSQNQIQHDR